MPEQARAENLAFGVNSRESLFDAYLVAHEFQFQIAFSSVKIFISIFARFTVLRYRIFKFISIARDPF